MKKILMLSMMLFLSACACMNSDEPEVVYETRRSTTYAQQANQNCDFYENGICYHYVYDTSYAPSSYRSYEPNRYSTGTREVRRYRSSERSCTTSRGIVSDSPCGKPVVRETREPVEVVYKKIRYTTVYEPKTYEDVSYEKEPYNGFKREGCRDCF